MSVTTVFRCFHADALQSWVDDREHFDEKSHPDCESIQLGVELLAVADLVARAKNRRPRALHKDFLYSFLVGRLSGIPSITTGTIRESSTPVTWPEPAE